MPENHNIRNAHSIVSDRILSDNILKILFETSSLQIYIPSHLIMRLPSSSFLVCYFFRISKLDPFKYFTPTDPPSVE
jgi:hypothetical protein